MCEGNSKIHHNFIMVASIVVKENLGVDVKRKQKKKYDGGDKRKSLYWKT